MPWKKNQNNEDIYIPSIYSKNELPTWEELLKWYKMMCKNDWNWFNCRDELISMPYWNIPENIYLCAVCCNQLNKMVQEDAILEDPEIKQKLSEVCEADVTMMPHFYCTHFANFVTDTVVYSLTETKDPMVDYTKRDRTLFVNVLMSASYSGDFGLQCVIGDNTGGVVLLRRDVGELVTLMLKKVLEYFTGKVGWKDIESDTKPTGCVSGFDPAL